MSVFTEKPRAEWVAHNEHAFAIRDGFPVTPGHTLVITRREVAHWFEATREEHIAVLDLIDVVKRDLDRELAPDGYNVGFNAGRAAGQTVDHLHVHVIPRYDGDMHDPRGGVRHVIPSRGNYKRDVAPLSTGGVDDPFLRHLLPLFAQAHEIGVMVAFAFDTGLALLREPLFEAVARGAHVHFLTSDYMNATERAALRRLLDWTRELEPDFTDPDGAPGTDDEQLIPGRTGRFESRLIRTATLEGDLRSFHPKAWLFHGPGVGCVFVGSSNASARALTTGIEWNLRADRDRDERAYELARERFTAWWQHADPLTDALVEQYVERPREPRAAEVAEIAAEERQPPPTPHGAQRDALDALAAARTDGRTRALVVLPTGLGKTWLAVFDVEQLRTHLGRAPRVLFLAHRHELLAQAADAFRRQLPDARFTFFSGADSSLDGDVAFAMVQKLSRRQHLERLPADAFDYVVVDEAHHTHAPSYRRVLAALDPGFVLGLTATPERADDGEILSLFDDFEAYRASIADGIELGRLVPFAYHGLRDNVDYENIPWRNRRFDRAALARAVETQARMEQMWEAWERLPATRTVVFCATIEHAEFVRAWLEARQVRCVAVHSGAGSADRSLSLLQLQRGEIDAICTVDLFNEGIDVPAIDRVVMLRPTESPVVFLQQLGRGLRALEGKRRLTVIDFVGNHRIFLERMRVLYASTGARAEALHEFLLEGDSAPLTELPAGCAVELQVEVKDLLRRLSGVRDDDPAVVYNRLFDELGARPRAVDMFRAGADMTKLGGGWFEFVRRRQEGVEEGGEEQHLSDAERRVLEAEPEWLREVERTEMTKSFKMVTLHALADADALGSSIAIAEVAARSHAIIARSPELFAEIRHVRQLQPDARTPPPDTWAAYWRTNPLRRAWAGRARADGTPWFTLDRERFTSHFTVPDDLLDTLREMTVELVELRLARYRAQRLGEGEPDVAPVAQALLHPGRLFTRAEVLATPSPAPTAAGILAVYLSDLPPGIDLDPCHTVDGLTLVSIGISPREPTGAGRASGGNIRQRLRAHLDGTAESSTLRLSLGCLLAPTLGLTLRRIGSRPIRTFTREGEERLSAWMNDHLLVCWHEHPKPWLAKRELEQQVPLPLNLEARDHPLHEILARLRREAVAEAERLDVVPG